MNTKITKLKRYLNQEKNVKLAFLFGSFAKGKSTDESDVDIAIYLKDEGKENSIWRKSQEILGKEVDLISLKDAPASLISAVFKTGVPLTIKNKKLYWSLYLSKSLEAEDFEEFALSYWKIFNRAASLNPEDKTRILERLQFLKTEMQELKVMKQITKKEYEEDKEKRRNLERWAENIINAAIDVAKIVLASEKKEMPKTYELALVKFGIFAGLQKDKAEQFGGFARLRNLLAHEYLDILYEKISEFASDFPSIYKKILKFFEKYISGSENEEE